MPDTSLIDTLAQRSIVPGLASPQFYTRQTMLALSHAIEDLALSEGRVRLIVALFQQGLNAQRQAARYRQLALHADRVILLGYDLPAAELPDITLVELEPKDALRDEWAVLVVGDTYQALLTTKEVEHD